MIYSVLSLNLSARSEQTFERKHATIAGEPNHHDSDLPAPINTKPAKIQRKKPSAAQPPASPPCPAPSGSMAAGIKATLPRKSNRSESNTLPPLMSTPLW